MNARDIAYGYAIGYNDGLRPGGEPSDDWQPPDWWLPVPEPEPMEICMLIWADSFGVTLYDHETGNGGYGDCKISVDWGDGTFGDQSATSGNNAEHTYAEKKQYVVKVTGAANANTFCYTNGTNGIQICKCGSGIYMWLNGDYKPSSPYNIFSGQATLKYVSVKNENGLWNADAYPNFYRGCFDGCTGLRRVDLPHKIKKFVQYEFSNCCALSGIDLSEAINIGNRSFAYNEALKKLIIPKCTVIEQEAFTGCRALKEVYVSDCTVIKQSAFSQCGSLEEIYAPNCTSVGDYAFNQCYNLQKVTFADGCTFGNGTFDGCPSLYPIPT